MKLTKRPLAAAATLAGAGVLALGLGAGSASANYLGSCAGTSITGQGASLQTNAQTLWTGSFPCTASRGITVAYTTTSSGAALRAWGADGGTGSPLASADEYIGTDDPPSSTQIASLNTAAGGADVAVVPVAQASVALAANVPAGCTVTRINRRTIEEIFRGLGRTWNDVLTGTGNSTDPACTAAITPVVRADASGTTYGFKHFLFAQNGGIVGPGSETWASLQTVNSVVAPALTRNQTWPVMATGAGGPGVMRSRLAGTGAVGSGSGGGDVVRTVNRTTSSLGYANAADVVSVGTATMLQVDSGVIRGATVYTSPVVSNNANCSGLTYSPTPTGASTGRNVDWSTTYATGVAGTYPYCVLTYDVALAGASPSRSGTAGYTTAGFTGGDSIATTVSDYLTNVVSTTGGQALLAGRNYAALPAAVQSLAITAANQVW